MTFAVIYIKYNVWFQFDTKCVVCILYIHINTGYVHVNHLIIHFIVFLFLAPNSISYDHLPDLEKIEAAEINGTSSMIFCTACFV